LISLPFERDLQKIAKINSSKKNQSFLIAKLSSRETQKIANLQYLKTPAKILTVPRSNFAT